MAEDRLVPKLTAVLIELHGNRKTTVEAVE